MAKYLKSGPSYYSAMALLALVLLSSGLTSAADAETLTDPTRPPPGFGQVTTDDKPVSLVDPVLQSVMISPRRKSAIINGKLVSLGGEVGDMHVISISDNQVVLMRGSDPSSRIVLSLYPSIGKTAITKSKAESAAARELP